MFNATTPFGVWNINANGSMGTLIVTDDSKGGIGGSVFDQPIVGFFDSGSGTLYFLRVMNPDLAEFEVYTGRVFPPVAASSSETFVVAGEFERFPTSGTVSQLGWFGQMTTVLPRLVGLSINPTQILIGQQATGTIQVTGPAPPTPPAVVMLATSVAAVATVPASVSLPAGSATATFEVTGRAPGSTMITATLGAGSLTAPLIVSFKAKEAKEIKEVKEKEIKEHKEGPETGPLSAIRIGLANPGQSSMEYGGSGELGSATVQAFIQPDERPPVGQANVNDSRHEEKV